MSTTLSTTAMVALLQARLPFNPALTNQFCMDRLNEAYRWLEQKGSFVWDSVFNPALTVTQSVSVGTPDYIVAPSTFDPGKVTHIYGNLLRTEIPFVPANKIGLYQVFQTISIQGLYSAYTIVNLGTNSYQFLFAPAFGLGGGGPVTVSILYHKLPVSPLPVDPAAFFPTPDQFDDMYVDLAEAEIRRRYSLSGWDIVLQKAQAAALVAADAYRTDKNIQPGLDEGGKEAQEKQLLRAE